MHLISRPLLSGNTVQMNPVRVQPLGPFDRRNRSHLYKLYVAAKKTSSNHNTGPPLYGAPAPHHMRTYTPRANGSASLVHAAQPRSLEHEGERSLRRTREDSWRRTPPSSAPSRSPPPLPRPAPALPLDLAPPVAAGRPKELAAEARGELAAVVVGCWWWWRWWWV